MANFVGLLTIYVIGWLIVYWWPQLRSVARARPRRTRLVVDGELGLAQVRLPHCWRQTTELADGSWLQASDPLRSRYFVVISESREDFDASVDLFQHSSLTRDLLGTTVRILAVRGPEERRVGGFRAVQYELDAAYDLSILTYLHTTVEGRRAFHQVLGWSTRSKFDRPTFERLLDTFAERPGPDPRPLDTGRPVTPAVTSQYEVH
jgi:hypothetical protein